MPPRNYARRSRRKGKGLLPPNPTQWEYEHHALDLREDLKIDLYEPLDHLAAFELLEDVAVYPHGAVPSAASAIDYFRTTSGQKAWSGLAMSLPDGGELVLYNDAHPPARIRTTLMEEFFHLWLNHPRTQIRVYDGKGKHRTFQASFEEEAYGSGAAALLPYCALKNALSERRSVDEIATQFGVSTQLVQFRANRTKLAGALSRKSRPSK